MVLKFDDNDSKELDDKEKQIDDYNTSSEDLKLTKTADKLSSPPSKVPLRPTTGHNEEFDTDEEDLKDVYWMKIKSRHPQRRRGRYPTQQSRRRRRLSINYFGKRRMKTITIGGMTTKRRITRKANLQLRSKTMSKR